MHLRTEFEVRIPACDRPKLLQRAVDSLRAQIYPHWRAVVFDDSTSSDSQEVIRNIADDRISYVRNPRRLGAAANIDQCFSPKSVAGGRFGSLLEDDNFWLPGFLSLVASHLADGHLELILANQRVNEDGVGLHPVAVTTRGAWFSAGVIDPLCLRSRLFFNEGLSNGGLVWLLGGKVNLQVGSSVQQSGLQEVCRSLLVKTPFLFIAEPQAVYSSMPKAKTARAVETNRSFGRGVQSICRFILAAHGRSVVAEAELVANRLGLQTKLVEALAYSGHPHLIREGLPRSASTAFRAFAKGVALRMIERDPCSAFLAHLTRNATSSFKMHQCPM
jgi:hypothetical protein